VTTLAIAIEQGEWELASLRLLLGIGAAAAKLPPETLTALIDLLSQAEAPPRRGRRGPA